MKIKWMVFIGLLVLLNSCISKKIHLIHVQTLRQEADTLQQKIANKDSVLLAQQNDLEDKESQLEIREVEITELTQRNSQLRLANDSLDNCLQTQDSVIKMQVQKLGDLEVINHAYHLNASNAKVALSNALVREDSLVGLLGSFQRLEEQRKRELRSMQQQIADLQKQLMLQSVVPKTKETPKIKETPKVKTPEATRRFWQSRKYDTYLVDPGRERIQLHLNDHRGGKLRSLGRIKEILEGQGGAKLLLATNGGMFHKTRQPVGLYVEKGKVVSPLDSRKNGYGNFYLLPNGVFFIKNNGQTGVCATEEYARNRQQVSYATQSGPMLLINGEIHPKFNPNSSNFHIRSGVGINRQGQVVFAISKEPVTFYEFAVMFRDQFGCKNALYLDGGISKMYAPALKRNELHSDFGPIISIVSKTSKAWQK